MTGFELIANQILFLMILVCVGVIALKSKLISSDINASIAKLIFEITMPLLIFTTLASVNMTPDIIKSSFAVFIFTYVAVFALYFAATFSSKIQKLNSETSTIHIVHTMFGNIVFLGFPLINSIFGARGLLYASIYQVAADSIMWTFGVYLFNKNKNNDWKENIKHLINPNTIAFSAGLLFLMFKIPIPNIIFEPLSSLGHTTIFLSMVYIGGMLAQVNIKNILKHQYVFIFSLNKMILVPIILTFLFAFLYYFLGLNIDKTAIMVVVLEAAMPAMATIVVLAKKFGGDEQHATENVFISTILSMITLPFLYWLLLKFI